MAIEIGVNTERRIILLWRSIDDRPLMVVTAVADAQTGWLPLQDEMVTPSTISVHRVLRDSTRTSLITDEEDAAISSEAILEVVGSVRAGTSLANP